MEFHVIFLALHELIHLELTETDILGCGLEAVQEVHVVAHAWVLLLLSCHLLLLLTVLHGGL